MKRQAVAATRSRPAADFPAVLVNWIDPCDSAQGWTPMGEIIHEPVHCRSVCFLIRDDRRGITLVACLNDEGECDHALVIPRACVRSIVKLSGDEHHEKHPARRRRRRA